MGIESDLKEEILGRRENMKLKRVIGKKEKNSQQK